VADAVQSHTLDNQAPFRVEGIPMQALRIQPSVGHAGSRFLAMSRSWQQPPGRRGSSPGHQRSTGSKTSS
jgi:hypothetical protein